MTYLQITFIISIMIISSSPVNAHVHKDSISRLMVRNLKTDQYSLIGKNKKIKLLLNTNKSIPSVKSSNFTIINSDSIQIEGQKIHINEIDGIWAGKNSVLVIGGAIASIPIVLGILAARNNPNTSAGTLLFIATSPAAIGGIGIMKHHTFYDLKKHYRLSIIRY